eukprot:TRINITY_DN18608_c0_g1_i5.p1 TRINITY_DN18608_c0_g1~~TRINITY_DN18608_c0_g1_i5.p1  ORF type:complete len:720 (+),score=145.84 TRINITY_DN18608_c0_g1_i5:87-2162(+)
MAAASAFDLLEVELVKEGDCSTVDTVYILTEEMLSYPQHFVDHLSAVAAGHSEQDVLSLKYQDEDGDWCTLNKETARDALNFVTERENECPRLKVMSVFKQVVVVSEVFPPPPREPVPGPAGQATTASSASSSATSAHLTVTEVLKEINGLSCGMDLRRLMPVLAQAALRVIEKAQEPALFQLLDSVIAFRDGHLKAENLPVVLPQILNVLGSLPHEAKLRLITQMKSEAKQAVAELRNSDEYQQQQQPVVEVHACVTCDGCGMAPIAGERYKHLVRGDFDYCKACFLGKTDQDPNEWVRVRSNVTGEVVSSYYGPAGETNGHHGVTCDGCETNPIFGKRFRCLNRANYDLCEACHTRLMSAPALSDLHFEVLTKLEPKSDAEFRAIDESPVRAEPEADTSSEQKKTEAVRATDESAGQAEGKAEVAGNQEQTEISVETLTEAQMKDALMALLKHQEQSVRCAAKAVVMEFAESSEVASADDETDDMQVVLVEKDDETVIEVEADPLQEPAEEVVPLSVTKEAHVPTAVAQALPSLLSTPVASARVIHSSPMMLGVEAQEDTSGRGDVTEEFGAAIRACGGTQGYRVGRIAVPINGTTAVPACAKIVVQNDGEVTWPDATVTAHVDGNHFGFPQLPLGPLRPGEVAEVVMDLLVPPKMEHGSARSTWTIVDASNSKVLGPILLFEVVWMAC